MSQEWKHELERVIGGKRVIIKAFGRKAKPLVEAWDGRSIDDIAWNLLVAKILAELYPDMSIGLEVSINVHIDDENKNNPSYCETPAPLDVVAYAKCRGEKVFLVIEVKWWKRWMGVLRQHRQYGARLKRQESASAIETLARCLDVGLPMLARVYGIHAYLLALIGEKPRKVSEEELRKYIANLTGYPLKRVQVVCGVRGPSQAKPVVKKALHEILKSSVCVPF